MATKTRATAKTQRRVTAVQAGRRVPGQGSSHKNNEEKNAPPSQWGRRLARLTGEKFGVKMVENYARNEGTYKGRDIVIKCAKSLMPPVSCLIEVLDRIDDMWAVYIMPEGHAEVWSLTQKQVRDNAYFTHGANVQKRIEIYYRHIVPIAKKIGELTEAEVESCRIP